MKTFRPERAPQEYDGSWLSRQFENIRKAATAASEFLYIATSNNPPDRTKDGELRLADGDHWNPRSMGYGLFWWSDTDSQWQRVFSIGTGGTVTQATSKSTAATLNAPTGEVTMNNAALAATTAVTFTLTNSYSKSGSVILINFNPSTFVSSYDIEGRSDGSVSITLYNRTAGSLSHAVKFRFTIIPGATS